MTKLISTTGNLIKYSFIASALIAVASNVSAQTPSQAPTSVAVLSIQSAEAYDTVRLPDDHYGRLVRYGQQLTEKTFAHIGPEVKDLNMRFSGNNLACVSCHQASATKKFGIPWVGVHAAFPQYRGREDEVSTVEERVNGCMERSMAGKPLPLESQEMKAFLAYMHFLSKGIPTGSQVEGRGLPPFTPPNRRADLVAGAQVYTDKCAVCHGADGAGMRAGEVGSASGYFFPPLWGSDSFNNGAGMNRILFTSAFIKANMPQGASYDRPMLSDDEAYDVAGFIVSKPRPIKTHLERDFPARWNKPIDAAFEPYVDGASADMHKYGPFPPLRENMKKFKADMEKAKAAKSQ